MSQSDRSMGGGGAPPHTPSGGAASWTFAKGSALGIDQLGVQAPSAWWGSGAMPRTGLWGLSPIALIMVLALLLPLAAHAEKLRTILAATPIARMDLPWWKARHQAKLEELQRAKPELLWLGDSITEDWEYAGPEPWANFQPVWNRFYGGRKAINLGFKGDTTASLLWRIQNGEVAGTAPKAAVILIGANNLGRVHWSAEDTVAGVDTIVRELHKRLPQTRILLIGILPSDRNAWVTETTRTINRMLADRYVKGDQARFIDVGHLFMQGGKLNHEVFYDRFKRPPDPALHPTPEGQALMAAAIEPTLATMLGDKPRQ